MGPGMTGAADETACQRIGLTIDDAGENGAGLTIFNQAGKPAVSTRVSADDKPRVELRDQAGDMLWLAPPK